MHVLSSMQAANCQWMLDVVLFRFENKYNGEIRSNGDFCCCDTSNCRKTLSELSNDCGNKCDPWFNVSVSPCEVGMNPLPCSVSTEVIKDIKKVGDYGYVFHFATNTPVDNVRDMLCCNDCIPCVQAYSSSSLVWWAKASATYHTHKKKRKQLPPVVAARLLLIFISNCLSPENNANCRVYRVHRYIIRVS